MFIEWLGSNGGKLSRRGVVDKMLVFLEELLYVLIMVGCIATADATPRVDDLLVNLLWCGCVLWCVMWRGIGVFTEKRDRLSIFVISKCFVDAFGVVLQFFFLLLGFSREKGFLARNVKLVVPFGVLRK